MTTRKAMEQVIEYKIPFDTVAELYDAKEIVRPLKRDKATKLWMIHRLSDVELRELIDTI